MVAGGLRWHDVKICSFDDAIHQTYVQGMFADLRGDLINGTGISGSGATTPIYASYVFVWQTSNISDAITINRQPDIIASKSGYHFFRTSAGDVFHDAPKEFPEHQNTAKVLKGVNYRDSNDPCVLVLFKCDWFEPIQLYAPYLSMTKDLKDWWAVVKATSRSIYEVAQCSGEVVDDNVDVEEFFQENKMPVCSNTTDTNENAEIISLVTQGEIEEVGDLDVGYAYTKASENEEEFVGTYDNLEVGEDEEEFINTYDDSDDDNELNLQDVRECEFFHVRVRLRNV
ncbi:hypothetical protein Tco_0272958 [Tanacetum coccineum]